MTPERDVNSKPQSQAYPSPASVDRPEDASVALFQAINERRARVENAEMLRRLRGL